MSCVLRPTKSPPKLDEYYDLSAEAQQTLLALEKKYAKLSNQYQRCQGNTKDPSQYYKSIYNATFKKEVTSPIHDSHKKVINFHSSNVPQISFSSAVSSVQVHSDKIQKACQNFNPVPYPSSSRGHEIQSRLLCEKKCTRNRDVTEVFMRHRPTDQDISESVLSLTQKTSAEDSPFMDLDTDVETDSLSHQDDNVFGISKSPLSVHEIMNELVTGGLYELKDIQVSDDQLFSPDISKSSIQSATYQKNTHEKSKQIKTGKLHSKESKNIHLKEVPKKNPTPDSETCSIANDRKDKYCGLWSKRDENVLTAVEKLPCEKATPCRKSSSFSQNSTEEPHFTLSFSDFELSQNSSTNSLNNRGKTDICTESPIVCSDKDCDLIRTPNCTTESPSLKNSNQVNYLIIHVEKEVSSGTESKDIQKNINVQSRKFGTVKCSSKKRRKAFSKDILMQGSERYTTKIDDEESPLNDQEKSVVIGDSSATEKMERSSQSMLKNLKSTAVAQKRSGKGKSGPTPKKLKSGFKPPSKVKQTLSQPSDTSSQDLEMTISNFSSLDVKKQQETIKLVGDSHCLMLTLLYSNDETTANTFYTASNYSRKKHLTAQSTKIQIKGLVILTNNPQMDCLLIPDDCSSKGFVKEFLVKILSCKHIKKIIPNCKDFLIGMHHFMSVDSVHEIKCENLEDPVIAAWLVDPENQPSSYSQMCQAASIRFKYDEQDWLACLLLTYKLMEALTVKLKSSKLWMLFTQIEMRLVPVLAAMEMCAISVDMATLVRFSDILKNKLSNLEEGIYKTAGHKFLLSSHVQLRQVLYEELQLDKKLPAQTKIGITSTTHMKSTSESSLSLLSSVHALPSLVLEYRQLQKLKSTYVDGIMSCVSSGTLMTHWDQTAAATGRLTSSQPNIQTIPKTVLCIKDFKPNYVIGSESEEVKIFAREAFISSPGHIFLAADFQQIELRILAHLSEDAALLSMFWKPQAKDVFISLTSKWKNKSVELVTFSEREQTKRIVYSVMYGVGKEKLSEYLKVKPPVAKDIMNSFLLQFPAIGTFTKKCLAHAKEFGYTETVCGRRRYFPHINSQSPALRAQAQRQAVNFCVQGTAADICKLAMLAVEQKLQAHKHLTCRLLIQIHDELVWDVPEDQICETKELIQQAMEDAKAMCGQFCSLQVPLTVALSRGKSWAHLSPFLLTETESKIDEENDTGLETQLL